MIPGFNSFFKKPRYQRFHFEPRYYDPVKEEVKEREERIKRELHLSEGRKTPTGGGIRGSFKRNARAKRDYSGLMRAMLILFITVGIFLYFTYGTIALYFLAVPIVFFYLAIKFKFI